MKWRSNGGYLAVGKLTGKLEKEVTSTNGEDEKAELSQNPKFLVHRPSPSSFVIRTPTATVTDLGTEFGVEVDEHQTSNVCVFAGTVNIVEQNQTGGHLAKAGEAVRIDSGSIRYMTYDKASTHFARTIRRQPAPVKLVDDFSGNELDRSKWWTNLWGSKGHADVVQRDGRVELINRGYLLTAREFDPDRLGGIKITGLMDVCPRLARAPSDRHAFQWRSERKLLWRSANRPGIPHVHPEPVSLPGRFRLWRRVDPGGEHQAFRRYHAARGQCV